ncbi:MAG: glycosyltransferase family 2 protein [Anderseniella sp.]
MNSPQISIVTPTRDRNTVLRRAIDSVRSQTMADYEHIIVDDGSSDGTADMVAGYGDPRIRYKRLQGMSGANAARNLGIETAAAPIVTFLDSDDEYQPFRLDHTLETLAANPAVPLMLSSFVIQQKRASIPQINSDAVLDKADFEKRFVFGGLHFAGSAITARTEALSRVGCFNIALRRMQDLDLLLRMAVKDSVVLSERIDWTKYNSPDSITRGTHVGFVEALSDLVEHNDFYSSRCPDLIPYMVGRRILNETRKLWLPSAVRSYYENLNSPMLGFSAFSLIQHYRGGKKKFRRDKVGPRAVKR